MNQKNQPDIIAGRTTPTPTNQYAGPIDRERNSNRVRSVHLSNNFIPTNQLDGSMCRSFRPSSIPGPLAYRPPLPPTRLAINIQHLVSLAWVMPSDI